MGQMILFVDRFVNKKFVHHGGAQDKAWTSLKFLLHFYSDLIISFQVKDFIWIWQISAFK